jgi:hypothetical protein
MTAAVTLADNASLMTTPTGTAPSFLCRAWVNFVGTSTVTIRASGNVSSITDIGAGQYTVNFTTAMADGNYSTVVTTRFSPTDANNQVLLFALRGGAGSTSSVSVVSTSAIGSSSGMQDVDTICVSVFR